MVQFEQVSNSRLFQSVGSGAGWWGVLLPANVTPPELPISLDDALTSSTLQSTFVYSAVAPDLAGANLTTFIDAIQGVLNGIFDSRALIFVAGFVPTAEPPLVGTPVVAGLRQQDTQVFVNTGVNVILTGITGIPPVEAQLASGSSIAAAGDTLLFNGSSGPAMTIAWPQSGADTFQPDNTSTLAFSGPDQGSFRFGIFIRRLALTTKLDMGFQVVIPNDHQGSQTSPQLSAMLPLADGTLPSSTDMIGFSGQINLVNPNNAIASSRTVLYFTGQNSPGGSETNTSLISFYRTNSGKKVTLFPLADAGQGVPAGLTINPGFGSTPLQNGFRFTPTGDFVMTVPAPVEGTPEYLIGGLSGTETIAFLPSIAGSQGTAFTGGTQAGSRIRFKENQAANAPRYPVPSSSPTGPPIDPKALLLDNTFQTAWGNVVSPPGDNSAPLYSAAPKGSDLFGLDTVVAPAWPGLLGSLNPGVALPADLAYPLLPMAGFVAGAGEQDMTQAQLEGLERQILSATRRTLITNAGASHAPSARHSLGLSATAAACPFYTTTPAGFISHVRCDGTWDQLLLGQMMEGGAVIDQVGFTKLQPDLQAAFQTSNLFLVVANANYLGAPSGGTFMPPASNNITDPSYFFNTLGLAGWVFKANVGTESAYSDYRNVLIVKGIQGKLTDLVLSPETWTMKDKFGAPTVKLSGGGVSDPDTSQLIPLSNWLNDYFDDALARQDDPFFASFAQIIQDPNWTGVLMLRVDIAQVPKDLAGITAGINDPSAFYAHHLGIEVSQINGEKVQQQDSSSIFGLVYYVDPSYVDTQSPHPIPPRSQEPYTFTLLTLKALFQNSGLKKFDSVAQITLNQLLGSEVTAMGEGGNIYNAVLLTGAFQMNGGAPVYSLSSATANVYLLANNVLTQVEIDTAVMSTRDDGSVSGTQVSWIALSGYMNFALIEGPADQDPALPVVDFYSFGSADSTVGPRAGLNFSNLGLEIRSKTDGTDAVVSLIEREMSFNTNASTPRNNSLFLNFQLELLGMQSGEGTSTPQSLGYLTVGTQYGLQGVSAKGWHGLQFKVNMGTPGALAGKVNVNSSLLCAWADDSGASQGQSGYRALIGILLPGAGTGGDLFSLQTVIKLSVGAVQLYYNEGQQSYLLLLNEIALKFLGLLKIPPNGATAFFLFGGPQVSSPTGLGWYAIYNQDQPAPPPVEVAAR